MTLIISKHYQKGKLVKVEVEEKEKSIQELNEDYDFMEAINANDQEINDIILKEKKIE